MRIRGELHGISQAAQTISYAAMAEFQQALADAILKDPDVASLSSLIGVDGTNPTLNTGRFQITLKPRGQRSLDATGIVARLRREVAGVPGIKLALLPAQDLAISAAVSPSRYHFVLQNSNPDEFAVWIPRLMTRLRANPH